MDSYTHISFTAADRSYFAILKKEIHNLATNAGFSTHRAAEVDIVVAEMASNLIKHAGGGEILVRMFTENDVAAIELISIDSGPGMADPARMQIDGVSTANTLGQGLGAMKRLSDVFQVYSLRDWGTILLSRLYNTPPDAFAARDIAEVRSVVLAKPGENVCGDAFAWKSDKDYLQIFLADGLGHGMEAHTAAAEALQSFAGSRHIVPSDILTDVHMAVKRTRGLVGTIAVYSVKEKIWRICGIGNIASRTQHLTASKNYLSYNGIIGLNIPNTLKEQEVKSERGQILIMCSDGIKTRWELNKHAGVFKYDLSILAAVIYKDFARKTDDMSVVVARINTAS